MAPLNTDVQIVWFDLWRVTSNYAIYGSGLATYS